MTTEIIPIHSFSEQSKHPPAVSQPQPPQPVEPNEATHKPPEQTIWLQIGIVKFIVRKLCINFCQL